MTATLVAGLLVLTGLLVVALRRRGRRARTGVFTALVLVAALAISGSVGAPAHASPASGCASSDRMPSVALTTDPGPTAAPSPPAGSTSATPTPTPTPTSTPTIAPTSTPTIEPTAPAVGSSVQSLTFTVRDAPETGYVVARRVWGGPRDVNNCVFERGDAPFEDQQVFGFGRPAGETTFRGTLEWQPISSGSCFFEATTISWDIEFYDNLDLVDTWRIYAIDGNSATTSLGSGGVSILAALALSPIGVIASLVEAIGGAIIGSDLRATSPEVEDKYSPIEATDSATLKSDGQLAYRWTERRPPEPTDFVVPITVPDLDGDEDGRRVEVRADPGVDRCVNLLEPGQDAEAVPFDQEQGAFSTEIRYQQVIDGRGCDWGRRALASWTVTYFEADAAGGAALAEWRIVNFSESDWVNGSVCQVVAADTSAVGEVGCTNARDEDVLRVYDVLRPGSGWTLTVGG